MSGTIQASVVKDSASATNNLALDASGGTTFGGKVLGDYTNATVASRSAFQTSTTNGSTGIYALPNGTSTAASWQATNAADPTNASKILIATNGSTDVQLVSGINGTGTYLPMSFYTNGTERMRIDTSGNLLVGTTLTNLYAQTTGKGLCYRNGASLDVLVTSDNAMVLNRTTTTGQIVEFRYSATSVGNISVTGSATAYNTTSDYRLKENVQPMTTGLATISALKPVTYDWVSDKSAGEGFIAHELQSVIPLAVTGEKDAIGEDGNPIHQGVDYSKIVVHLVAALQEAVAKIDALETRLVALEAK